MPRIYSQDISIEYFNCKYIPPSHELTEIIKFNFICMKKTAVQNYGLNISHLF